MISGWSSLAGIPTSDRTIVGHAVLELNRCNNLQFLWQSLKSIKKTIVN